MRTSLRNIKNNEKICIIVEYNKKYYRIEGCAKIYSSGKYFDIVTKRSNPPLPKHAIIINVKEVFDLDKVEKIF